MDLAETKSNDVPNKNLWINVAFDRNFWSLAIGLAGGICVLVKDHQLKENKIELERQGDRFTILKFTTLTQLLMRFGVCLRLPQESEKDIFWNKFISIINDLNFSCIIIDDFN